MRTKLLYLCFVVIVVCLCLMRWITVQQERETADDMKLFDSSTRKVSAKNNCFLGYVGDGTGMSCIEFVTENGDTMLLSKTSEYTGRDGIVLGSMQIEPTNLYAVETSDNGETVSVMVNMTELRTRWQHYGQGFVLAADSMAIPFGNDAPKFRRWHMEGDNILFAREVRQEGGVSEVTDTMRVVSLSPDTLVLCDMYGEETKYWH